jgi:hypothetical protein
MTAAIDVSAISPQVVVTEVAQTNVRYDEDWSVIRAEPRSGWRSAKYIPIDGDGVIYLTLGAEARARVEAFDNNRWGDPPTPDDGYLWLRLMPHVDVHVGPVRLFVQGIAAYARGVGGGNGPVDRTGIDLLQGFADVRVPAGKHASVTLRGGRQLLALGSERLVGTRYGPNVPQAFDGATARFQAHGVDILGLALRPVQIGQSSLDDRTSTLRRLDGIYLTTHPLSGTGIELYWLQYRNKRARFSEIDGQERRETVGTRLYGQRGSFGWNWEAMLQRGAFGSQRIRAWSVATETAFRLEGLQWQPKLRIRANIASGDGSAHDRKVGTFNALFPKGKYFGELSPIGPVNLINVNPDVEFSMSKTVSVGLMASRYWRQRRADGVYDLPGELIRAAGTIKARHIGDQAEVTAEWHPSQILSISASLSVFRPGAFIRQSGPAKTIRMLGTEMAIKF